MSLKSALFSSAMIAGTVLSTVAPMAVSAETALPQTANKSADITIVGGDLTITPNGDKGDLMAPSFNFEDAKVSTSAQNGIKAKTFNNVLNTADTYKGSVLSVTDDRGNGEGWNVTAKLGEFKADKGHTLKAAKMNMKGAAEFSTTVKDGKKAVMNSGALAAGGDAVVIGNAAKDSGMGVNEVDLKGSTLDLPTAEYAGHYVAALDYVLTSGPHANPAKG